MRRFLSYLLQLLAWLCFVAACWVAASDAQGAILFVVALPLSGALLGASHWLAGPACVSLRLTAKGGMAFLAVFFASMLVPPLSFLPAAVIGAVVGVSTFVTGQTPYARMHMRHDVAAMLEAELTRTQGREIDFARFPTGYPWTRVCVLGPYTNNAAAAKVLGFPGYDPERWHAIAYSDSISLLAFADDNEKVVRYTAEVKRGRADLADLGGKCFGKEAVAVPGAQAAKGAGAARARGEKK